MAMATSTWCLLHARARARIHTRRAVAVPSHILCSPACRSRIHIPAVAGAARHVCAHAVLTRACVPRRVARQFVCNYPRDGDENKKNELWINDGTGEFTAASGGYIVSGIKYTRAAAWADVDGDGDADLVRALSTRTASRRNHPIG